MLPLCEVFDLSYSRQRENLKSHPGFKDHMVNIMLPDFFGDNKKRACLTKKGFVKWVLQLSYTIIREDLQPAFLEYQENVLNYLYDSVFQREAVLSQKALDQLEVNKIEQDLKVKDPEFQRYLDLKAKIARSGKTLKEIDQNYFGKQLTVFSEDEMKG